MDITRIAFRLVPVLTSHQFDEFRTVVEAVGPSAYNVRVDGSAIDFLPVNGEPRTRIAPVAAHHEPKRVAAALKHLKIGEWARVRYKLMRRDGSRAPEMSEGKP
jgi:hypothetical protein